MAHQFNAEKPDFLDQYGRSILFGIPFALLGAWLGVSGLKVLGLIPFGIFAFLEYRKTMVVQVGIEPETGTYRWVTSRMGKEEAHQLPLASLTFRDVSKVRGPDDEWLRKKQGKSRYVLMQGDMEVFALRPDKEGWGPIYLRRMESIFEELGLQAFREE